MINKEIVKFEKLVKNYYIGSTPISVLKGIDITINEGEFVGIMGTSGSGKSTLLNVLGLLDTPTSGKYFLDGVEVESLSDNNLAVLRNKKIGFIFQSFNLFPHLTIAQNIEVPMVYTGVKKKLRRQVAHQMAEKVHLTHRLKHKPSELSGGEKQRVAIARALSNNPSFLLADEPTGNLDESTSKKIIDLFEELRQDPKITIAMVTHNIEYRNLFDRVIDLKDGNVVIK